MEPRHEKRVILIGFVNSDVIGDHFHYLILSHSILGGDVFT